MRKTLLLFVAFCIGACGRVAYGASRIVTVDGYKYEVAPMTNREGS